MRVEGVISKTLGSISYLGHPKSQFEMESYAIMKATLSGQGTDARVFTAETQTTAFNVVMCRTDTIASEIGALRLSS